MVEVAETVISANVGRVTPWTQTETEILKVGEGEPEAGVGEVDDGTQTDVLEDVEGLTSKASDVGGIVERRGLDGAKNVERSGKRMGP